MKSDDGLRHTENQIRFTRVKECSIGVAIAFGIGVVHAFALNFPSTPDADTDGLLQFAFWVLVFTLCPAPSIVVSNG